MIHVERRSGLPEHMHVTRIFIDPEQHRARAGWRLLIQLALFAALLLGLDALSKALGAGPGATLTVSLLYLTAGPALMVVVVRRLDHRRFTDLGLHVDGRWWMDFGFGFFIGAFMMSGIFFTERSMGWVAVTGTAATNYALPITLAVLIKLVFWVAAGLNEELVFRGYQLRNLAEGFTGRLFRPRAALVLAALVSSALFGFAHAANPSATAISTANIVLGGLLMSLPVLLTGELAMPIGLHIAWNLFQGTVYGFPVSGSASRTHLLTIQQTGPTLWTGGAFGPEAGLLGVCWVVASSGLVVAWCRAWGRRSELARRPAEVVA